MNVRYAKLLTLVFMIMLCSCSKIPSAPPQEYSDWFTYQSILVGNSNLDQIEKELGAPLDKSEFKTDTEEIEVLYYDGFHIILKNKIASTIIIDSESAPKLWNKIGIHDDFNHLLELCPTEPVEFKYSLNAPPENLTMNDADWQVHLLLAYNEDYSILQDKQLHFILQSSHLITFFINPSTDTIEEIQLQL